MSDGRAFFKNAIAFNISREMALDFGLVEATEAEAKKREAELEAFRAQKRDAQPRLRAALSALAELDGIERTILDLHAMSSGGYWLTCDGCDFAGYEGEPPDWPCRTVELIANAHGIYLSEFRLYDPKGDA